MNLSNMPPPIVPKKIMFLICNSAEAILVNHIWQALKQKAESKIINISCGELSRGKSDQAPEETLSTFGLPFKRLTDYQTLDVTKILRQERPNLLVLGSDQEFLSQSFIYAADGLNIPTLLLRLGISTNVVNVPHIAFNSCSYRLMHNSVNIVKKYLYKLRTMMGSGYNPFKIIREVVTDVWMAFSVYDAAGRFGSHFIAVAGTWERSTLVQRGVQPDKIFITGNPDFSVVPHGKLNNSAIQLRENLGIRSEERVILLLTSAQVEHGMWTSEMRSKFINNIINSLSSLLHSSFRLLIKIHPIENIGEYKKILMPETNQVILCKDLNLVDGISISDVVIAGYSTTVLQACALHKPVIILNIFKDPEYIPYVQLGLAIGVYKIEKLKETIEKIVYDLPTRDKLLKSIDSFMTENRQMLDGKAAFRIAELILALS